MTNQKYIEEVRLDVNGNIAAVRFKGNTYFINTARAYKMAKNNRIENVIGVNPRNAVNHIRSIPDCKKRNNLVKRL